MNMKCFKFLFIIALAVCASLPFNAYADVEEINVNGVIFRMIHVEGGSFMMGSTADDAMDDEAPVHRVTLNNFNIGETEVTQELWEAVMGKGNNPSVNKGAQYPVDNVSWNECIAFIEKLNYITKRQFRLPTEAEWEFAACGGLKSEGYKYSGSDNLDNVAWYSNNSESTHQVGLLYSNELGICDMTGNVFEWCLDFHDFEYYSRSPEFNPCNTIPSQDHVIRGGSIFTDDESYSMLRVTGRYFNKSHSKSEDCGFRLVEEITGTRATAIEAPKSIDYEEVVVGEEVIKMIRVEGGTFVMGNTEDKDASKHRVTLSDYYIGETEVTRGLWNTIMSNDAIEIEEAVLPVVDVSWEECKEFIEKLNEYTGKNFRLPTEAEWEFAARGGVKSNGYEYSGSNTLDDVAWYSDNSNKKPHKVGTKKPNELGLYDMSGNVWEWCEDVYDSEYYSKSPAKNPCCKYTNEDHESRVRRGGCYSTYEFVCKATRRFRESPSIRGGHGFRLAW